MIWRFYLRQYSECRVTLLLIFCDKNELFFDEGEMSTLTSLEPFLLAWSHCFLTLTFLPFFLWFIIARSVTIVTGGGSWALRSFSSASLHPLLSEEYCKSLSSLNYKGKTPENVQSFSFILNLSIWLNKITLWHKDM